LKTVLVITDGIGFSEKTEWNAFHHAKTPNYDYLFENAPYGLVSTYGSAVGLPDGQMGNSEIGHMTIGSGRTLYSDLVKISKNLEKGEISENSDFKNILKSERIHLIGLFSDGGVHSHINHLFDFIKLVLEKEKLPILHLITDGRDVSPKSALQFLEQLQNEFGEKVEIASIGGRFYTMDRDKRWERVESGYRAIVEANPKSEKSVSEYVSERYENGETDEFITPIAFGKNGDFRDGDSVLFYNFRSDRMREIVEAIGSENFSEFERNRKDISIATATKYRDDFPHPILFPKEIPTNGLSEIVSKNGLSQLHTAETEKYAHVTFFFNGGVEEPFQNETRILVNSPKVKTYDEKPEMSAVEVCDEVIGGIEFGYDLIVVNFANGDMVGHTGVFEAGKKAVETVDTQIGRILESAKNHGYGVVLTSDHGNCEEMKDDNQNTLTNHTVGDVWAFVIADGVQKVENGNLSNIAPTVLKLLELPIPSEMNKPLF
jgi:2,3-bisphosphoglycerate-independent phosphoglycerate mutase